MKAGDVLFFRSEVWHSGSLNRSDMTAIWSGAYSHRNIAQKFCPGPGSTTRRFSPSPTRGNCACSASTRSPTMGKPMIDLNGTAHLHRGRQPGHRRGDRAHGGLGGRGGHGQLRAGGDRARTSLPK